MIGAVGTCTTRSEVRLRCAAVSDDSKQELMERHKLSEAMVKAWAIITQSGGDTGEHEAVTRLDSWRQATG